MRSMHDDEWHNDGGCVSIIKLYYNNIKSMRFYFSVDSKIIILYKKSNVVL